MIIRIKTGGDAHRLLEDFIKYAKLNPGEIADIMQYDREGFRCRLRDLEQAVKNAERI